jgi:hypothetical protein
MDDGVNSEREIDQLFEELVGLLKNPDVCAQLTAKGINSSLAMLAASGLHAYLKGNKADAAEDLATAAEEIGARMRHSEGAPGAKPS